ncbi:cardiolipin synthase [Microbacteriaceae bacterium SG_E_30_P1]|uniref:Cardiolipin synthase n=1 Tax=Antiquaquibacter oligotrophicus TaxID=2880260 RepID=A0ABT6KPS6_9MICO|nr:cardiolipin synthase [Antiquaquibacter oligotrophicus]MDH6182001.1 cardiolipin synthase [Antiquaquibacter oligotrophicus]UDF12330.1 cardiolipin synthase [Antiquaquibacter oligotrophicus]
MIYTTDDPTTGWFSVVVALLVIAGDLTIRVLAVIYIPRNRRPQTAMAWLLAIFFIPYVGIILFLLLGSRKLPRKRRKRQLEINKYILETTDGIEKVTTQTEWPGWLPPIVELNRTLGAMPLVGGNSASLYPEYELSIAAMARAIDNAQKTVHIEFYILSYDATTAPFFEAMDRAIQRGVIVRVLLDHIASIRAPGYKQTIKRLKRMGALWKLMLPVQPLRGKWQRPDLRNHRKIVVVDGLVAFTGSQNMVDSSYNKPTNIRRGLHWKDLMVRFEGPIVAGINALFVTDWFSETDELLLRESPDANPVLARAPLDAQVVPSGPGFEGENNLRLFNSLVYAAQHKVIITSPYFVPDDSMLYAITTAAQSGLDVQLFVSEVGDQFMVFHAQRSYYEQLLRAGVRIWLYPAPTVLHSKHFTIDDEVAVIGSSNMDMRSFSLNLEISVMVRSREFVDDLREVEQSYREVSRELTLDEWMHRSRASATLDNVMRLTAALQ